MLVLASDDVTEIREIGSPDLLAIDMTTAEFPWIVAAVTVTCETTTSLTPAEAAGTNPTNVNAIAKHEATTQEMECDFLTVEYYPS